MRVCVINANVSNLIEKDPNFSYKFLKVYHCDKYDGLQFNNFNSITLKYFRQKSNVRQCNFNYFYVDDTGNVENIKTRNV